MKHLNIKITGQVQGVGYRNAAKRQARLLGITGFVKNNSDGSVYIEAEGDIHVLEEFVKWCWDGPTFAQVDDITYSEWPLKNFVSFETVY